jgi:hypothetical protein
MGFIFSVIIFVVIHVFVGIDGCQFMPSEYCTVYFSIFIALLSFPLHFFRVVLFMIYIYLWVMLSKLIYKNTLQAIGSDADKYDEAKTLISKYENPSD